MRRHPTAVPYVTFGLYRERHIEAHLPPSAMANWSYAHVCDGRWVCTVRPDAIRERKARARWERAAAALDAEWTRKHPRRAARRRDNATRATAANSSATAPAVNPSNATAGVLMPSAAEARDDDDDEQSTDSDT